MPRNLDELWSDPKNWTARGYRCTDDPRLIVPKRTKAMGWTLNFAHPSASTWLTLLLVTALAPSMLLVVTLVVTGTRDPSLTDLLVIGDILLTTVGPGILLVLGLRASRV